MKIHEIWHFPKEQCVEGLFAGYMDTWLKMKQESSRRPCHGSTQEELQNYINHYEVHEDVQMEPGKIVKNAAKHSLAKLMLTHSGVNLENGSINMRWSQSQRLTNCLNI